jgi:hypothetical protein
MDDPVPLEPVPRQPVSRQPMPMVAAAPQTSGLAITSLVMGCMSFICGLIFGPLAILLGIIALRDIKRSNGQLKGEGLAIGGIVTGAIMTLLITPLLLLPAIQAARAAAQRSQSLNNLKQISIAFQNYADTHQNAFPAAKGDASTQLSWRVHLLPYLEQEALYKQFHFNEPWDSEHNRALIARMPDVFKIPGTDFPDGETAYLAVTGLGTAFGDGTTETKLHDFVDGTSNTILVVEADNAVPWTRPDDWQFDPNNPTRGLGNQRLGGFLAVFADAHTEFIESTTPPEVVGRMMTRDGRDD